MAECPGDTHLLLRHESGGLAECKAGQIFAPVMYTKTTQYCSMCSHLLMPLPKWMEMALPFSPSNQICKHVPGQTKQTKIKILMGFV